MRLYAFLVYLYKFWNTHVRGLTHKTKNPLNIHSFVHLCMGFLNAKVLHPRIHELYVLHLKNLSLELLFLIMYVYFIGNCWIELRFADWHVSDVVLVDLLFLFKCQLSILRE